MIESPRQLLVLHTAIYGLLGIGAILCGAAFFFEQGPRELAFGWVWGFASISSIALGALFLVAVCHLMHATWSVVLRRIAEMMVAPLGIMAVFFLPLAAMVIFNDYFNLYPWADADIVSGSSLLQEKQVYLNTPFFLLRTALYFAIWLIFGRTFIRISLGQDTGKTGPEATQTLRNISAPFLFLFAFTMTFATIDWLMSLNPYWYSTIIGVYLFSGMALAALAAISITAIAARKFKLVDEGVITNDHLYNLSVLIFVFANFWAYIAFSQYMLIWYGNLPEESFYLADRLDGGWLHVSIAMVILRWIIPFFALLARRSKRNASVLFVVSIVVLVGHLLDLYWMVMPELYPEGPVLTIEALAPVVLMAGAFLWAAHRFMEKFDLLAKGDPLYDASRQFHLKG